MNMKNETALITGSTSGIGKKLAEFFLKEGCQVAICSRSEEKLAPTLAEFKNIYGDRVIGLICDVTKPEDLNKIVSETVQTFGSLRILVANAGINLSYGPFDHMPSEMVLDNAKSVIGVNLFGVLNSVAAVMPQMKKQRYGRIITLSGGGADRPLTHMTIYSASKGGVVAFSKCFAEELKEKEMDIKINIFQPGMLKTGLTSKVEAVPDWRSSEDVLKETATAMDFMGGDINESVSKVLPYVLPSCTKNGTVFRGFSLFKLITGAMKLQKAIKKKNNS
ncbi:SDR family NAD(P)-dependent oxidoreductase [Candidatus Lokiarchaeum ossiferum]